MTVLYPNMCYNDVCYKVSTLYTVIHYGPRRQKTCLWGFRPGLHKQAYRATETS